MSTLKHKGKGPQAMTANELVSGLNVWMTAEFGWSKRYGDALLSEDQHVIDQMQEIAVQAEAANQVVNAYFIDTDNGTPARYRERFRTHGPSYDTADLMNQETS